MKRIIFIISFLVGSILSAQKPIATATPIPTPQKPKTVTPKFKLSDKHGDWNAGDDFLDSLKQEFIQAEVVKKINSIRVANGMKALILDEGLRPAAVQNAIYNRWCLKNRIVQYPDENCTMTHIQRIDMPNFEEIYWPDARIKLLDQTRFSSITEELTYDLIPNLQKTDTYQKRVDEVIKLYKASEGHWYDITKDPKWDAVYVFYDFKTITSSDTVVIVYIILGNYEVNVKM